MRYILPLLFLLAAVFPCQARDLPVDAVQGNLTAVEYPYVKLAGERLRLSPGARIFDIQSRIIPPYPLSGSAQVVYKLDIRGDVQEIWFLTADEITFLKNKKKSK